MSNELKLPSYIYEETPCVPITSAKAMPDLDIATSLKMDMLSDHLNDYLLQLDNKINNCLAHQVNMLTILSKIEKKLEEFE